MYRTVLNGKLGVALLTTMALGIVLQDAQGQIEWNSAGPSTDFMDPLNWNPSTVPGGSAAVIRTGATGGNQSTIGDGDLVRTNNVFVWTGADDAGVLNVEGGELNVASTLRVETEITDDGCCWIPVDRDTSAVMNQSGGVVDVRGDFHLGRDNYELVQGIYNLSAGTLNVGGGFLQGDAAAGEDVEFASGIMNVSGGTMTVESRGQNSSVRGQFNVSGDGTAIFANSAAPMQIGQGNAGDGRFHITGNGSLIVTGTMNFGQQQTNGSINKAEFIQEGGTSDLAHVDLGGWAADGLKPLLGRHQAIFSLSGGTSKVRSMAVSNTYITDAQLIVTGGSLQIENATTVAPVVGAEGVVDVSGGEVRMGSLSVGVAGIGDVNHSGGLLKIDTDLTLAETPDGRGTYNLSGGVLDMSGGSINFGDGDAAFNFDGGKILNAANINFDLVNNGGAIAPGGSAGTTNIGADYLVVSGDAALEIELGGAGEFDQLIVSGGIILDGSLDVSLINNFNPIGGESFDILDFASLTGAFSAMNLPALGAGLSWNTTDLLANGILSVDGAVDVLGDFNGNGVLDAPDINDLTVQSASGANDLSYDLTGDDLVDKEDVTFWIRDATIYNSWVGDLNLDGEFNSTDLTLVLISGTYETGIASDWSQGDFNGDGVTDSSDFTAGLADGGYEQGPRTATAAVPEPSSAVLVFVGIFAIVRRRR